MPKQGSPKLAAAAIVYSLYWIGQLFNSYYRLGPHIQGEPAGIVAVAGFSHKQ